MQDLQLLDADRAAEIMRLPNFASLDAVQLTNRLRERGWLTGYQAELLLMGRGSQLVLGVYRLMEPLGEGGMGQVFKANHLRLNRVVALKVIRPQTAADSDAVRRFQREAQAAAQLMHPNVVTLYDSDEVDGVHFIAMEYVEGIDLSKLVKQSGPLPITVACDYVRQVAVGLQHAHECGLVHRDIKPSNLLLSRRTKSESGVIGLHALRRGGNMADHGMVKILDMGLARLGHSLTTDTSLTALTQEGSMMGTPDYVAPEQARNAHMVDIRADLYSLGCTFYYLLTGVPPFPDGTSVEKLLRHQLDAPRAVEFLRPQTPPAVQTVVRKLMAKQPELRYQTPRELADVLQSILLQPTATDRPAGAQPAAPAASPPVVGPAPAPAVGLTSYSEAPTQVVRPGQTPPVGVRSGASVQDLSTILFPARKMAILQGHSGCVMALAFSEDGMRLATGGIDESVRLWHLSGDPPRLEAVLHEPLGLALGEIHVLAFAPDQPSLISGSSTRDGLLWRWHWPTSRGIEQCQPFRGEPSTVTGLAFAPDGSLLAAAAGKTVWLWSMKRPEPRKRSILKGHRALVESLAFAPSNRHLAVGAEDGVIYLWEVGRFWCRLRNVLPGHSGQVTALCYSPDGTLLASGGLDQGVRVWDATGEEARARVELGEAQSVVRLIQFLPGGRRLVVVDDSGYAVLWDLESRARVREWMLDKTLVVRMALSPDGHRLAAGSTSGNITLYEFEFPGEGV